MEACIDRFREELDADGRQPVVRNGYRPEPCSTLRRAMTGVMPRARTRRRYLSWSYPRSA